MTRPRENHIMMIVIDIDQFNRGVRVSSASTNSTRTGRLNHCSLPGGHFDYNFTVRESVIIIICGNIPSVHKWNIPSRRRNAKIITINICVKHRFGTCSPEGDEVSIGAHGLTDKNCIKLAQWHLDGRGTRAICRSDYRGSEHVKLVAHLHALRWLLLLLYGKWRQWSSNQDEGEDPQYWIISPVYYFTSLTLLAGFEMSIGGGCGR